MTKQFEDNVYIHPTGDKISIKRGEDGILEGMKFEVVEEEKDVQLIREVMEEPVAGS